MSSFTYASGRPLLHERIAHSRFLHTEREIRDATFASHVACEVAEPLHLIVALEAFSPRRCCTLSSPSSPSRAVSAAGSTTGHNPGILNTVVRIRSLEKRRSHFSMTDHEISRVDSHSYSNLAPFGVSMMRLTNTVSDSACMTYL